MNKIFFSFISLLISFNLTSQSIVGVNPNTANQGQYLTVTLSGQNTHFNQGTSTQVWFSQGSYTLMGTNTTIINNNNLLTDIAISPNAPTGFYDSYAFNYFDGTLVKPNSFSVFSPSNLNTNVYPNKSKPGKNIDVLVDMPTGFSFNNALLWYQKENTIIPITPKTQVLSMGYYGESQIPANADTGYYSLIISNSTSFYGIANALKLEGQNKPTIDSVVIMDTTNYDTLHIYGHNTHFTDTSLVIDLNRNAFIIKGNIMIFSTVVDNDEHIMLTGTFVYAVKSFGKLGSWMTLYNFVDDTLTYPFVSYITGSIGNSESQLENIQYFPNPTSNKVRIQSDEFIGEIVNIEVFAADGKALFGQEYKAGRNVEFNLANYPSGFYNVKIVAAGKSKTVTVVKR